MLFAEVSASGTVDNSSGGVTVTKLATIGPSGGGSAAGEVNVADRGANVEAVFVDTNNSTGGALDRPFRLVVVC